MIMKKGITYFKNIATIITINNNSYWVFLGVIDRKPNAYGRVENNEIFIYPTNHNDSKWGIYPRKEHNSLAYAQSEAQWLKEKLNGDNPMLVINPQANNYTSFNNIVREPYVREESISMETETYTCQEESLVSYNTGNYLAGGRFIETRTVERTKKVFPQNPDQHFKPLDVIWIRRHRVTEYYHVAIYLGQWDNNYWMCHLDGDNGGVEIVTWKKFLDKDGFNKTHEASRELIRFHPIIPFKHHREIAEQINWASDRNWQTGNYSLRNRNCEHLANMLVLGINFSRQVYNKEDSLRNLSHMRAFFHGFTLGIVSEPEDYINNGKKSICLSNEKRETNNLLGQLNNKTSQKIKEQYEAKIEAPMKISECRIM